VNQLGWIITNSEGFVVAIETYLADIEKKLAASPTEKRSEELLGLIKELAEFVSATQRLIRGEMNPLDLPPAFQPSGAPIPNYFVLKIGRWRGFYRLDYVAKVGVGILTLHEDNNLQDRLVKLLEDAAKKL
jgi:hypothetical protein